MHYNYFNIILLWMRKLSFLDNVYVNTHKLGKYKGQDKAHCHLVKLADYDSNNKQLSCMHHCIHTLADITAIPYMQLYTTWLYKRRCSEQLNVNFSTY